MKIHVLALAVLISVTWVAAIHDDGQPGCKTSEELEVKTYRNNWDPTRYWVCEELGKPATEARCRHGTAWLDSQKTCVPWEDWEWETPQPAPSKP